MIGTATKKPVTIEFALWTGENCREMYMFLESKSIDDEVKTSGKHFEIDFARGNGTCSSGGLVIKTLEGEHLASVGDYIIKGVKGEFYPCKPDIFKLTYDIN